MIYGRASEPGVSHKENGVALLARTLRLAAWLTLVASAILVALGQLWLAVIENTSPVSTGAVSGLYLLMDSRLRKDGVNQGESIILSILFANVFAQTFELIYHFTFPVYLNYFHPPFLTGDSIRYLALEGTMLLPILLLRKHLRFGVLSAGLLSCFVASWAVWILYGFPQYFTDVFYFPRLLSSQDPFHLSLWLNYGSKAILALFFGSVVWRPTPPRWLSRSGYLGSRSGHPIPV